MVSLFTIGKERGLVQITRRQLITGILLGVTSMLAMGVGIVMIKPLLERSSVLWAIEVRLIGAAAALFIILGFCRKRKEVVRSIMESKGWKYMVPGSFLGTYIALMFWIGGMKYAPASIASALNQTSNIFIFIFAAIFLKEKITRHKLFGIVLAVAGVVLIMHG